MKIGAGRQLSRCTPGAKLTAIEREGSIGAVGFYVEQTFMNEIERFYFRLVLVCGAMLPALAGYHDHHSLACCMGEGRVFFACRAA
jgi:hypothetical protein